MASYNKQNFVPGQTLTATHLNHMEDGIASSENLAANKVGYAEVSNGMLNMYADNTKSKLIASVSLPTGTGSGTGSGLSEAQVRAIIQSYNYITTDTNTTYTFRVSGSKLYIKPSNASEYSIDLPAGEGPSSSDAANIGYSPAVGSFTNVASALDSLGSELSTIKEDLSAKVSQVVTDYFRDNPVAGVTPEVVAGAVSDYLTLHPVEGDGDTTYSFSISGNILTITPSKGTPIVLTLPSGGTGMTDQQVADVNANTDARHTHENKAILDGITAGKVAQWDAGSGGAVVTYVTPEQYGAKGDGVTDDTLAIQSALDYARNKGVQVHLGAKTYAISDTLRVEFNAQLIGTSIGETFIKNTNNNVYAINQAQFFPIVKNLMVDSYYGIMVGRSADRCICSVIENVGVKNCHVGINVSYTGGYNRIEKCKINTNLRERGSVGIYVGEIAGSTAGTNYVYISETAVEPTPVSGDTHPREPETSGLKIGVCTYCFIDKCDFVGYENGIMLQQAQHTYVSNTTIFDNTKGIYCAVPDGKKVFDFKAINTVISGEGYALYTEPTNGGVYRGIIFTDVTITDPYGVPNGFYCNNLDMYRFDGFHDIRNPYPVELINCKNPLTSKSLIGWSESGGLTQNDVQNMISDALLAFKEELGDITPSDPTPSDPVVIPDRVPIPSGDWALPTTGKKYLIIGTDDDNLGNASFFRMLRTYNFPYTMNVEAENINKNIGNDTEDFFTSSDAKSVYPNGVTVAELGRYMQINGLGEVSQHGSSEKTLWDSDMLTGTALDGLYATYTSGGGAKSKDDFRLAIMDALKDSDIRQDAPYVERSRETIENALGFRIYSVGIWGGTPSCVIDGVRIDLSGTFKSGLLDWKEKGYLAVSRKLNYAVNTSTYDIGRVSYGIDDIKSMIESMAANHAMELYWHMPFTNMTPSEVRAIMDYIKTKVDAGEVQVVTRSQYANLGTWGGISQPVEPDEPVDPIDPPVVEPEEPVESGYYLVKAENTSSANISSTYATIYSQSVPSGYNVDITLTTNASATSICVVYLDAEGTQYYAEDIPVTGGETVTVTPAKATDRDTYVGVWGRDNTIKAGRVFNTAGYSTIWYHTTTAWGTSPTSKPSTGYVMSGEVIKTFADGILGSIYVKPVE